MRRILILALSVGCYDGYSPGQTEAYINNDFAYASGVCKEAGDVAACIKSVVELRMAARQGCVCNKSNQPKENSNGL